MKNNERKYLLNDLEEFGEYLTQYRSLPFLRADKELTDDECRMAFHMMMIFREALQGEAVTGLWTAASEVHKKGGLYDSI